MLYASPVMGSETNGGTFSQQFVASVAEIPTPTPIPPPPTPIVRRVSLAVQEEVPQGDLASVGDGQCVAFVQAHGFSELSGNAGTWKRYINTTNPRAGDVVVLNEGPVGHVALVESVSSQSFDLWEQNYEGPYIVSRRTIPKDYERIVGFVMPP